MHDQEKTLVIYYLMSCVLVFLSNGGWGDDHHINAEEIAGIGLGAAALVGAVGYLVLRRRSSDKE